jgi:hypothetical protein
MGNSFLKKFIKCRRKMLANVSNVIITKRLHCVQIRGMKNITLPNRYILLASICSVVVDNQARSGMIYYGWHRREKLNICLIEDL